MHNRFNIVAKPPYTNILCDRFQCRSQQLQLPDSSPWRPCPLVWQRRSQLYTTDGLIPTANVPRSTERHSGRLKNDLAPVPPLNDAVDLWYDAGRRRTQCWSCTGRHSQLCTASFTASQHYDHWWHTRCSSCICVENRTKIWHRTRNLLMLVRSVCHCCGISQQKHDVQNMIDNCPEN